MFYHYYYRNNLCNKVSLEHSLLPRAVCFIYDEILIYMNIAQESTLLRFILILFCLHYIFNSIFKLEEPFERIQCINSGISTATIVANRVQCKHR